MKIGNDIIDLKYWLPQNKAEDFRYIKKICTPKEREALLLADNPNLLLLRFWTMKEAAYKVVVKLGAIRAFIPKRLECLILDENKGEVHSEWGILSTFSEITTDYIHSIAANSPFEPSLCRVGILPIKSKAPEIQSQSIRIELLKQIADSFEIAISRLDIVIINDIPTLKLDGMPMDIELSMSHDGNWGAYLAKYQHRGFTKND